jgi:hypothetical protein
MKGLQLNTEEKQLLVESLLFTACADVCSDHTLTHQKHILDLAEKINDKNIKLFNIYTFKSDIYSDAISEEVFKRFPNIPQETEIID